MLDVHPVRRGERAGYRGRVVPADGWIVVVAGGTAHGIGLEAPTSAVTLRQRAVSVATGSLEAAGLALSPYTINGKKRWFLEPPHMQSSQLFLPRRERPPTVGEEIPVQLGGGIRTRADVERWLAAGVRRVILGSAAVKDPGLVREACRAHPGRVAVGIDARDGLVATEGWAETSALTAAELALRFEDAGAAAVIYTDIGRDGMGTGLNLPATAALAAGLATPVIASGGVGGPDDLRALRETANGLAAGRIEGVIVGRALYDGRVDPAGALALLAA